MKSYNDLYWLLRIQFYAYVIKQRYTLGRSGFTVYNLFLIMDISLTVSFLVLVIIGVDIGSTIAHVKVDNLFYSPSTPNNVSDE